jgi:hypothetical protein
MIERAARKAIGQWLEDRLVSGDVRVPQDWLLVGLKIDGLGRKWGWRELPLRRDW